VGEQVKTARCGVFTKRYPTKQGVFRVEQAQTRENDYATGEGNEKSHLRNQKEKVAFLPRFWRFARKALISIKKYDIIILLRSVI